MITVREIISVLSDAKEILISTVIDNHDVSINPKNAFMVDTFGDYLVDTVTVDSIDPINGTSYIIMLKTQFLKKTS